MLFGAEFSAELERGRALAIAPANREPLVELRDMRKLRKRAGGERHAWPVLASIFSESASAGRLVR